MNFKEKITVITPTFNRAHTLNRVYESLLRQSFKDFKWVIMDDGSTDHTEEVIRNFINDNQIKIIKIIKESLEIMMDNKFV